MKSALDSLIEELKAGTRLAPDATRPIAQVATARPAPVASPARAIRPTPAPATSPAERLETAPCGSPYCAGCYDVGEGKKIHPPRCGQDYLEWLKKWEGKGRVQ